MSPSDWIKHLTIYKTPWEKHSPEEQKSYNSFILNLWMSMEPSLIELINDVQKYQVPNRDHYNLYLKVLPKKSLYLRWIKAKKGEYSKDVVERLAAFYSCSTREINDSIECLDKQQIINILEQTGLGEKEIKQFFK
jgi:ribonuclease HI